MFTPLIKESSIQKKIKISIYKMDTHDEEFGKLIRNQIAADKKAKEQRDNTHAQGGEPSKPQSPLSLDFPL